MSLPAVLHFENTALDVVDRAGNPWLRLHQVGVALGYSRADSINKIYQSNADEFTDQMTALVKLPDLLHRNDVAGQLREVRIFSLRGCHLLAMLARTDKAKAFRSWVLDILDGLTPQQNVTAELIGLMRDMAQAQKQTLALIETLAPRRKSEPRDILSADVPAILALKADQVPQAQIARQLKLSTASVSLIVRGYYRINDDGTVNVGSNFYTHNA